MKKFVLLAMLLFATMLSVAQVVGMGDPDDRQKFAGIGNLQLESGAVIQDCAIGFRAYGRLNNDKSNGILFPSWFAGTARDVDQYATPWVVVDTFKYCLIIADALGDGVSTSPSNSSRQPGPQFPLFSIRDIVKSQYMLLTKTFGIKHLHAVIGISMGAMQAFQWGVSYPGFAGRLIPIVGSPQLSSYDLMGYTIYRRIIENDPDFNHGNYKVNPVISLASMLLEFSITTPQNKVMTMSRDSFAVWQQKVDTAKAPDWDNTYYQMMAVMSHDIAKPFHGSLSEAARHIRSRMLIISSRQDHLVNPIPSMEFSKMLPAKLLMLNNDLGHEAPSFDDPVLKRSIVAFLDERD